MKADQVVQIPLGDVIPTPDNPRTIRRDDPEILELAQSVKEFGVLQPVLARPHPTEPGKYDLRAGARRHMAATIAGLQAIPVIVRELTDEQALKVTILENLQRSDLRPMEEARGVRMLLDKGWDLKTVAAELGKSPSWVVRRAQLTKLSTSVLVKVNDPTQAMSEWPVAALELIATLPAESQDGLFTSRQWLAARVVDVGEIRRAIGEWTRKLTMAPWALDAKLNGAPACAECRKRSSVDPLLFDDIDTTDEKKAKRTDRCLDGQCWRSKAEKHVEVRAVELEKEHGKKPILVRGDYESMEDRRSGKVFDGVRNPWEIQKCKQSEKGARLALVVSGPDAGRTYWVKTQRTNSGGNGGSTGERHGPSSADLKRERAEVALEWAAAWLAKTWAEWAWVSAPTNSRRDERTEILARTLCVAADGSWSQSEAQNWLRGLLELSDRYEEPTADDRRRLRKLFESTLTPRICAFALFTDWTGGAPESDISADGHVCLGVRQDAAASFPITEGFLRDHCKDNVLWIAKQFGVKVPDNMEAIEAILAARLPAGTLTEDLIAVFGAGKARTPVAPAAADPAPAKKGKAKKDTRNRLGKKALAG